MKTTKVLSIFLVLFLFFVTNTQAQVWKKVKDKTKEKTKEKVEEKIKDKGNNDKTDDNNNNNNTDNAKNKASQEYIEFINDMYFLTRDYDAGLSLINLKKGQFDSQRHLESAKKLDYQNTVARLEEEGKKEGIVYNRYDEIMDYGSKYLEFYNSSLEQWINGWIEDAYKYRNTNEKKAIESIIKAKNMAEGATLIIPEEESAQKLLEDAKASYDDIAGEYYAEVYTSDFHKKNVGNILFSKTPVEIGNEDPNQFVDKFNANDNIYAVVYLNRKIKDLGTSSTYNVYIDGNLSTIKFAHNEQDYNKSYYIIEVIPDPEVAVHSLDPVKFADILANLSPRNHELKISMQFDYGDPVAEGTVNLDWADVDCEKIKQNAELAQKNAKDNWAKNMQLPEIFSKTNHSFSDPALSEYKIKTMFKNANSDVAKILEVHVSDRMPNYNSDWVIYTNSYDIPTSKQTTRYVYFIYKGTDGWCYFTDDLKFVRDYEGAGKYGPIQISTAFKKTKIHCDNVK